MDEIDELVYTALGEASAVFMKKEIKGTEIIMPTKELDSIAEKLIAKIKAIK